MARETVVRLVDDLDQSRAETTVRFGWQGANYEVDLSQKNAKAFEAALAPYLQAARRVSGRGRRASARSAGGRRGAAGGGSRTPGIREWATSQGYTVAARGRIPAAIVEAYQAAQKTGGADGAAASTAGARKATKATRGTKSTARKSAGRKATARKATGRKSTARKATGRRGPAKKAASSES